MARHAIGLWPYFTTARRDQALSCGCCRRQIGYFGGEAAAKPKLLTTLATAGAFSLVFALVFLWNVILTPAKLDDDEKKIERDLRAQVDQKNQAAEKQAAIDDLAEERLKH
jgi:hypothetical protein